MTQIIIPSAETASRMEGLAKGAVRWIPDDFCSVLDYEGHGVLVPCVNQIATYSKNGNALVQTSASGVPNPTGEVVTWDYTNPGPDFITYFGGPPSPCFLYDTEMGMLFTSNWRAIVTPSGQATFMCHYAAQWAVPNPWE